MTAQLVENDPVGPWAAAVAGHVRWVHGLLAGVDLPAEHKDALRSRLWSVRTRAADPELRVAVFGETSSGKSTLLNAFLRRRLLPSSARVTTRTTTVLRHRPGTEGLAVRTADDVVLTWPSQSFRDWAGETHGSAAESLEAVLNRVLTTDLADRVRGLEVLTDVPLLGGGVTVIDTPGFSVTDRGHRELAEAAARQADLALVVVPAVAAMSLTLMDFLTGPLRDHHDRCAFVLTKLDLLDEEEREEAVEVVAHRLRDAGIADAVVVPCAPGIALTEALAAVGAGHRRAVSARDAAGPAHLKDFLDVEAAIVRLATERRHSAIAATVLGLLSELLAAVEETIDRRREELGRSRRELAALTLPDFSQFLDSWARRSRKQIKADARLTTAAGAHAGSRGELAKEVEEAVAGNKINNPSKAAEEVSRIVRLHLRADAERKVAAAVRRAGELLASAADELAHDFAGQYSTLAGLAGETRTAPAVPSVTWTEPPSPDLSGIDRALSGIGSALETSDNWRTGGGAAAGALVGSMIAPGIGTVIGGVLGAAIGTRSADATRQRFLEQARPVIANGHDEIDRLVADCVKRIRNGAVAGTKALRREYDTAHRAEIDRLTAANDRQLKRLAAAITKAERTAEAARRRREEVLALRRETAATHTDAPAPEEE